MSVTQYNELAEGRTKTEKAGSTSTPPEHRYGRRFLAKTNLKRETEDSILNAIGIPLGGYHPDFPIARCVGRRVDRVPETLYAWHAVYEYTTNWAEIETSDEPTFFRDVVRWGTRFIELPLVVDAISDLPVINTAKDRFDPPIMAEYGLDVVNVEKNYAEFPAILRTLRNTKNAAEFTLRGQTVLQGEALLKSVEITDELFHNALPYFKASIELILDPLFFHRADVLNDGLNELFGGVDTDKRKILIKGEPAQSPQPLAANGSAIPAADVDTTAIILNWNKYTEQSWLNIGLPV